MQIVVVEAKNVPMAQFSEPPPSGLERDMGWSTTASLYKREPGPKALFSGADFIGSHLFYVATGKMRPIPEDQVLYHYTNFSAFESIIETGQLWASHYTSMNDRTEIDRALTILYLIMRLREDQQAVWEAIKSELKKDLEIYIVSLSRSGNALSQWTRYAYPGGVSIGFPQAIFYDKRTLPHTAIFRDVVYSPDEQISLLNPLAMQIQEIINNCREKEILSRVRQLRKRFMLVASVIKDQGFQEEAEVRIVIDGAGIPFDVRETPRGEVRYRKFNFKPFMAQTDIDVQLAQLFCAPSDTPDDDLIKVYQVLSKHMYKFMVLRESGIPYR